MSDSRIPHSCPHIEICADAEALALRALGLIDHAPDVATAQHLARAARGFFAGAYMLASGRRETPAQARDATREINRRLREVAERAERAREEG